MEDEVKQIMLGKLKEMAEITPNHFMPEDITGYVTTCSVMGEIAKILLEMED